MNEACPSEHKDAVETGWARVEWLVRLLVSLTGIGTGLKPDCQWTLAGPLSAPVRREARRMLAVGEALARRLVGIMALEALRKAERSPQAPAEAGPHGDVVASRARWIPAFAGICGETGGRERTPRIPAFALFEPVPTLRSCTGLSGPGRRRLPSILARPRAPQTGPKPPAILRRVAALAGVLAHRHRAARRLARWLSRKGQRKPHNLRPGDPPGLLRVVHEEDARIDDLAARLRDLAWARAGPVVLS